MPSAPLVKAALRAARCLRVPLLALGASVALAHPSTAEAFSPYLVVPDPAAAEATPAFHYANMSDDDAYAELDRRHILYSREGRLPGVRAPVRLTGRLHGVYFHSSLPPEQRVTSPFEILDARLALALDDFAALLERHDIDEVIHYTMYRPNVAAPDHGVHEEALARAGLYGKRRGGAVARVPSKSRPASAAPAARSAAPSSPGKATQPAAPTAPATAAPKPAGASNAAPTLDSKARLDAKGREPAREPAPGIKQKTPKDLAAKPHDAAPGPGPAVAAPKGTTSPAAPRAAAPHGAPAAIAPARSAFTPPKPKTTWAAPGTRHPAGLAIDVGQLHKRDGGWINVARHFQGRIGDKTCGDGVRTPDLPEARELRSLVCEAQDLGLFTYVLTPNYNVAHADHFHMEIRPTVHWFLYH